MIAALVPAKALDQAKTRLAALLSEDERRRLALSMLEDVVRALCLVPRIRTVSVVSPDCDVLERARALKIEAIAEPELARGINEALSFGRDALSSDRAEALLVVLADVPALTPSDIEAVLDAVPRDRGVVICPSRGGGTSALALRPPDVMPFCFGVNSFESHTSEASALDLNTSVLQIEALVRDIDEPDDLCHLIYHPADTATHRLLNELRITERLSVKQ